MGQRESVRRKTKPAKFKVGDIVVHRGGPGTFQVVEILRSGRRGGPSLYGCVEVRRYAEQDLILEAELERQDQETD